MPRKGNSIYKRNDGRYEERYMVSRDENGKARGIIEAKGVFPDVLKKAMSVNRNAHAPLTESAKFGF